MKVTRCGILYTAGVIIAVVGMPTTLTETGIISQENGFMLVWTAIFILWFSVFVEGFQQGKYNKTVFTIKYPFSLPQVW